MLFDKVPFLYGSGVIPNRFKEIRETVKNVILATFFDEIYLKRCIRCVILLLLYFVDIFHSLCCFDEC